MGACVYDSLQIRVVRSWREDTRQQVRPVLTAQDLQRSVRYAVLPDETAGNALSEVFGRVRTIGKNMIWAEKTGILCLTRTPTNALMWAHYADKHQGMVIGIDAAAAGFTDERTNFIPAQYGSIVYVSRREVGPFISQPRTPIAVGATHHFPADHYEKLQRVFLHKPIAWSYEEEVRVIKSLHGASGDEAVTASGKFSMIRGGECTLHLYALPDGAIREVYFGIRADIEKADAVALKGRQANPEIAVFECVLDNDGLSVGARPYASLAEIGEASL